ncbi:enoyl-CoA hydratase/isomerase family protein [Cupriavidus taiwanensis]|uniref:Fatty acid oxidation complex subunit alpha 2 n=1 Tax=Cupriavidus taiwanensis TaxID=164546 RepID=A0A375C5U9_9BURK
MERPETGAIRTEDRHGILLLAIENPPVNALSNHVRKALFDRIAEAQANDDVLAIVIYGHLDRFSGGADIREFNGTRRRPFTSEVAALIEDGSKPVVAAVAGFALGGGLELAMGAHMRIAAGSARFGLPEVRLGLLPGGGRTQRLPRLVGLEHAFDLILSGRAIGAEEARTLGLIDEIVADDQLLDEALTRAKELARGKLPLRRTGAIRARATENTANALKLARLRLVDGSRVLPAHEHILELVLASTKLPLREGIEAEHEAFQRCVQTPEHKELAALFFATRAAARAKGRNIAPD